MNYKKYIFWIFLFFSIFWTSNAYDTTYSRDLLQWYSKGYFQVDANNETKNGYKILFDAYNTVDDTVVNYYKKNTQAASKECLLQHPTYGLIITRNGCSVWTLSDYSKQAINSIKSVVQGTYTVDKNSVTSKGLKISYKKYYNLSDSNNLEKFSQSKQITSECLLETPSGYIITSWGCSVTVSYTWAQKIIEHSLGLIAPLSPVIKEENNEFVVYNITGAFKYFDITSAYTQDELDNLFVFQDEKEKYYVVPKTEVTSIKLFSRNELESQFPELNNSNALKLLWYIISKYPKGSWHDWKEVLSDIKKQSQELTKNLKTDDEKAYILYSWLTQNITYDTNAQNVINKLKSGNIDIWEYEKLYNQTTNEAIQAPFGTFKNKNGVCEGISYLYFLMLEFSWIHGSQVQVGIHLWDMSYAHAWNKIGNYYYDATFGITKGDAYYKLPYELMYADRLDGWQESYLWKNMSEYVDQKYKLFASKYPNAEYFLLLPYKISSWEDIYVKGQKYYGNILSADSYGYFYDYTGRQNRLNKMYFYKEEYFSLLDPQDILLFQMDGKKYMVSIKKSEFQSKIEKEKFFFDNIKVTWDSLSQNTSSLAKTPTISPQSILDIKIKNIVTQIQKKTEKLSPQKKQKIILTLKKKLILVAHKSNDEATKELYLWIVKAL